MSGDKLQDTLEGLIDAATLDRVLETINEICILKSEHISAEWQDKGLARSWTKAGNKVFLAAQTAKKEGL